MTYVALAIWLLLIFFTGMGVYELWSRLLKPAYVNWALLPGTVVSEMAYIFGCLITGGEVRSKLLPGKGGSGKGGSGGGEPNTQASHSSKFVGPMIAAVIAVAACGAALFAADMLLDNSKVVKSPVVGQFSEAVPTEVPQTWDTFWDTVRAQVTLVQTTAERFVKLPWGNWRVILFVYLTLCLAVRLSPARRPMRPTLAAVGLAVAAVAVAASALDNKRLTEDIWPMVGYVWCVLLLMLAITLVIWAIAALIKAVVGKEGGGKPAPAAAK